MDLLDLFKYFNVGLYQILQYIPPRDILTLLYLNNDFYEIIMNNFIVLIKHHLDNKNKKKQILIDKKYYHLIQIINKFKFNKLNVEISNEKLTIYKYNNNIIWITYFDNGNLHKINYYKNNDNNSHNKDGPAIVEYYNNSNVKYELYFVDNKCYSTDIIPWKTWYYENGNIKKQIFTNDDQYQTVKKIINY